MRCKYGSFEDFFVLAIDNKNVIKGYISVILVQRSSWWFSVIPVVW